MHVSRPANSEPRGATERPRAWTARRDRYGVSLKASPSPAQGGEILGIAGIAGNGQAELLLALSGEHGSHGGADAIKLGGRRSAHLGCRREAQARHRLRARGAATATAPCRRSRSPRTPC
jgi:ABC-type uncharacterized transport system ATPase subunit